MKVKTAEHPSQATGLAEVGGGDPYRAEQPWFYIRGRVVRIVPAEGRLTIASELTASWEGQLVSIRVDGETAMESRGEGSPAGLAVKDISLGDTLAVEGPPLEMTPEWPSVRARWVAREKSGVER